MTNKRKGHLRVGFLVLLAAVLAGGAGVFFNRDTKAIANEKPEDDVETSGAQSITVKSVRPRQDKSFQMTVERPADVEAYYRVAIEARVAGEVQLIRVARGSRVKKGQFLVQIYVPDRKAAENERANFVVQRKREYQLGVAKTSAARSAVKTAMANVEEKRTLLKQAKATTQLRQQQFERLDSLWRSRSLDKNARDEGERNFQVAEAAEASAVAARIKAEAEVEDAREYVKVMEADAERILQLIEVAKADHEEAKAMVEYATVKAPFRGTVIDRKVNPGSFVQNASTGNPTSILTLERTDIVTVVMRVPDNFAPFVTAGTEAIIELDALPGIKIHGKVTRFAPSLASAAHDRTMPVEVDLWNAPAEKYKAFFADPNNLADLKEGPLPIVPEFIGTDPLNRSTRLMAGMYGKMTLVLRSFGTDRLVPSQAIIREGGRTKIWVVKDGKAHLVPVQRQIDDGTLAKVDIVNESGQIVCCLTGKEEVIVTNQEELTEGQVVTTTPLDDWAQLKK